MRSTPLFGRHHYAPPPRPASARALAETAADLEVFMAERRTCATCPCCYATPPETTCGCCATCGRKETCEP